MTSTGSIATTARNSPGAFTEASIDATPPTLCPTPTMPARPRVWSAWASSSARSRQLVSVAGSEPGTSARLRSVRTR
ncbi:hypothetical protein ACLESD_28545 [Pyxidicoccus sp. 3LFB2]